MRLRFLWIGKTKDRRLAELEGEYLGRLEFLAPTERSWVPELKKDAAGQIEARLARETKGIERKLKGGYLVVLDESGKQFSSRGLADFFQELMNRGVPEVSFVAGGYWGVPDQIKSGADVRWSLSKLTFPHELARVVLLEQVYRSMAILKGLPYHK